MFCQSCGKEIPDGLKFCRYCGHALVEDEAESIESEITKEPFKKKKTGKIILVVILCLLLLCAVGGGVYWWFFIRNSNVEIEMPTFSVEAGSYDEAQSVEILSENSDQVKIYYTLDGTTPTEQSKKYYSRQIISVDQSLTIKCIAMDSRGNCSEVAVAEYTIGGDDDQTSTQAYNSISEYVGVACSWNTSGTKMSSFNATASSALADQGSNTYKAENVLDNNLSTAWMESQLDDGQGAYIELTYQGSDSFDINEIYFINGYAKSQETFDSNGAPTKLSVSMNQNDIAVIHLLASYSPQYIQLDTPITLKSGDVIRFEIKEVSLGSSDTDHDTGISEIMFK